MGGRGIEGQDCGETPARPHTWRAILGHESTSDGSRGVSPADISSVLWAQPPQRPAAQWHLSCARYGLRFSGLWMQGGVCGGVLFPLQLSSTQHLGKQASWHSWALATGGLQQSLSYREGWTQWLAGATKWEETKAVRKPAGCPDRFPQKGSHKARAVGTLHCVPWGGGALAGKGSRTSALFTSPHLTVVRVRNRQWL